MEISDRIRKARNRAGLTQRKLAKLCGVSAGLVGQWENSTKAPGRETLMQLAAATGVSVAYLLGQADDPADQGARFDGDTLALLKLWNDMSPRQRRSHLELFRTSVALKQELEKELAEEVRDTGALPEKVPS